MRILFINSLDKRYGGTYRARLLFRMLKELGYQVIYVESNYDRNDGINIPQKDTVWGYLFGLLRRTVLSVREDYDILFLHKILPLNFLCIIPAKLRHKRILIEWDDLDSQFQLTFFRRVFTTFLERHIPRYADCIITHNRYLMEYAEKVGAENICIVSQVVDTDLFDPKKYSGKKNNILLWVGTLTEGGARDLDIILEGFQLIKSELPDAELWIVGDGPLRNKFESLGVDGVKFIGIIPHRDIPEYIAQADIALIFMRNNLGNKMRVSMKLLEYLAMQKKVVGYLVGASQDRLGRFCYLCRPNAESLANKVMEVMKKNQINVEARDFIRDNYSINVVSRELEEAISKSSLLAASGLNLYNKRGD